MSVIWSITKGGQVNVYGGGFRMGKRRCHLLHDGQDTPEMSRSHYSLYMAQTRG